MTVYIVVWEADYRRISFESVHKTKEGAEKAIINLRTIEAQFDKDNNII